MAFDTLITDGTVITAADTFDADVAVIEGKVVYPAVAEAFGLPSADPRTLL